MRLLQILLTAANAVAPVMLLILLGYYLKRTGFLGADFVRTGKKLVFHIFLPCLLFLNVYNIESFADIAWDIVIYAVVSTLVIFLLALVSVDFLTPLPQRRGVILQCSFRSNYALIGLSLAAALGGDGATAVAAVISAFAIPLFNILAVVALSVFVESKGSRRDNIRQVLKNIAKNPMILSIALGFVCLLLREAQTAIFGSAVISLRVHGKMLYTALSNLKAIASPFSLVILGAEFELSAVKGMRKEIVAGTLWRLVLAPVLGIGTAILLDSAGILNCGADVFPALVALFGSPVAVSSVIMAGNMGSDEQLAAQLVVWTSLFSILTIFLQVCLLMGFGYIPM